MTQWGLDTLFNPAKRHMDEEKQRLQSTREEIGDSSGGKRIDLESGKVTIRRGSGVEASTDDDDDDAEDALADSAAAGDETGDAVAADAGHLVVGDPVIADGLGAAEADDLAEPTDEPQR